MPGRYARDDLRAFLCLAEIAFGLYALAIAACRDGIPSVSRSMTYIISKQTEDPSGLFIIYLWCGIVCFNTPADRHRNMDQQEQDILLLAAGLVIVGLIYLLPGDRRAGRVWRGAITAARSQHGAYNTTIPNLYLDDDGPLDDLREGKIFSYVIFIIYPLPAYMSAQPNYRQCKGTLPPVT